MEISRAIMTDLDECVNIIFGSELGKRYYPKEELLREKIEQCIEKDCFYAARDDKGQMVGIIWYQLEGLFGTFPYLHMVVVKEECQNQGIGTILMDYFEGDVSRNCNSIRTKAFLLTTDYAPIAEKMYIDRGYVKVCEIPGLFRLNITEKLYMKIIKGE